MMCSLYTYTYIYVFIYTFFKSYSRYLFYSNFVGYAAAFRAIQQVDINSIAVQSYNRPEFSDIISNGYIKL